MDNCSSSLIKISVLILTLSKFYVILLTYSEGALTSFFSGLYSSATEWVHVKLSPHYAEKKENKKAQTQWGSLISLICAVASLCLAILGIALLCAVSVAAGLIITMVSLPAFYFSYNSYRIYENTRTLVENPMHYQSGFSKKLKAAEVRAHLSKGTFLANWLVDCLVLDRLQARGRLNSDQNFVYNKPI